MNKTRVLTVVSVVGVIGSAIASGIGTYKAYPKLKEAIQKKFGFWKTVRYVAKDYVAPAAIVAGTVGTVIATEVIGEKQTANLTKALANSVKEADTVKTWYKDQSNAIKEEADENTQKKIKENVKKKEESRRASNDMTEYHKYRDVLTGVIIETTEMYLRCACEAVNKELIVTGAAPLITFYGELGAVLPNKFQRYGWSWDIANWKSVNPYLEFHLETNEKLSSRSNGEIIDFYYTASPAGLLEDYDHPERFYHFDPEDDFEGEGYR